MRRFCIGLAAVTFVILTIVGCGSSDGGGTEVTQASDTSTTQASDTSTTQATETSTTQAPTGDSWTTIATLSSSDPPWKGMDGILVSEPFTVTGEVQVVLDMPDAGDLDGVIVAIIPADKATDLGALMAAIQGVVTLIASAPTKVVSDLDGTYVLFNSVPATKAWSVDVQTRP